MFRVLAIMTMVAAGAATAQPVSEQAPLDRPNAVLPAPGGPVPKRQNASGARPAAVVTQFRVRRRTGIWEVTRGGVFYGDYVEEEHAIAAARSGVRDIVVAAGGSAELASDTASRV